MAQLLNDLPDYLKIDVSLHINRSMIKQVPMFAVAPEKFLGAILIRLRPLIALPGSYIIRKGEFGEEMYFISRGEVSVVITTPDGSEVTVAALGYVRVSCSASSKTSFLFYH